MSEDPTWSKELRQDCCTHDGEHHWGEWGHFQQKMEPFSITEKPPSEPMTTQSDVKAYRYRWCRICGTQQREEFRSGIREQTV